MKYLIIFIVFLILLAKFLKQYNSNFTLSLFYGKKGAGKSTIFVRGIIKYMKKGYTVFTDIPCNLPGVYKVNSLDLATYTLPPYSFIAMDEGGLLFDNRSFKTFPKGLTEWFKLQRHYKCICWINSQSPDIDLKIRNLADKLYIVRKVGHFVTWLRPLGRQVKLIESTAEADSRIAEDLYYMPFWTWRFYWLPKYWKYFDSFAAPHRDIIPSHLLPCAFLQDFQIGCAAPPMPAWFYPGDSKYKKSDIEKIGNFISI